MIRTAIVRTRWGLRLVLAALTAAATLSAGAATYYVDRNGAPLTKGCRIAAGGVGGDTPARAVRHLQKAFNRGCFGPGDTVVIADGLYRDTDEVFASRGRFDLRGTRNAPITIRSNAADPSACADGTALAPGRCDVVFEGRFLLNKPRERSGASDLIFVGIEFRADPRDKRHDPVLTLGGRRLTFQNVRAHGLPDAYSRLPRQPYEQDVITISGDVTMPAQHRIVDSEIFDSDEDCIDMVSRVGLRVENSYLHHCRIVQIKGGARDVVYTGNLLRHIWYNLSSNGMDCRSASIYCGAKDLIALPPGERYQAKNVLIEGNRIEDANFSSLDYSGWHDFVIRNNMILRGAPITSHPNQYVIRTQNMAAIVFPATPEDNAYCRANPGRCLDPVGACRFANGQPCNRIRTQARNGQIYGNTVHTDADQLFMADEGAVASPNEIRFWDNTWLTGVYPPVWKDNKREFHRFADTPWRKTER